MGWSLESMGWRVELLACHKVVGETSMAFIESNGSKFERLPSMAY
jgi:hypothetical protein